MQLDKEIISRRWLDVEMISAPYVLLPISVHSNGTTTWGIFRKEDREMNFPQYTTTMAEWAMKWLRMLNGGNDNV